MVFDHLVPGVQHGDDTKRSFKTSVAELKKRLADRFKEKS